jgi:[ribosomal protein S5]-alanine N-acetyltransferase
MRPPQRAPKLSGAKVRLRPWELHDAASLKLACGDPEICRLTTVPRHYTLDKAESWIRRQHGRIATGTAIVLAIEPASAPQPVGMVGLYGLNEEHTSARLGHWVVQGHRRSGLATDAVRILADWAFDELDLAALHIDVEPNNKASLRVTHAVGATHQQRLTRFLDGENRALERFALRRPPCPPRTHAPAG